jgi:predicted RNA-binding protein
MKRYWINTISKDHVQVGVAGGFTQAGHGKNTGLKRLSKGDFIIFYSPKTSLKDGEPLQSFTAISTVDDDAPYQTEMTPDFHPWRRNVKFLACQEAGIKPLLDALSFIKDKARWGYPFRMGLFEISKEDAEVIAAAMKVGLE